MPGTVGQHAAKSCANYAFGQAIPAEAPVGDDWRVNALFYAAVQAVDAYLVEQEDPADNHYEREERMSKTFAGDFAPIFKEYKALKELSRFARYYPEIPITPEIVVRANTLSGIVCKHMRRFVGYPLAQAED